MPTLPLPQQPETAILGSALPVTSDADALSVWPGFIRRTDPAPIRDALVAAQAAICRRHQEISAYAAAQSNILHATGLYLDGLGEDLKVYRRPGEKDEPYRTRMLQTPKLVTSTAILAAADAILAPYTDIKCQLSNRLDAWFVRAQDIPRKYLNFVWDDTASAPPDYPERLYEDHADINGGYVRRQSDPGGARVYDGASRVFLLRVPDVSGLDLGGTFAFDFLVRTIWMNPEGFYVGQGDSALNTSFPRDSTASARTLYESIVSTIDRIKPMGVEWILDVDKKLQPAA